jgi:hypothetical protein
MSCLACRCRASLADVVPSLEGGDAVLFRHVVDGIEAAAEDFPPGGETTVPI